MAFHNLCFSTTVQLLGPCSLKTWQNPVRTMFMFPESRTNELSPHKPTAANCTSPEWGINGDLSLRHPQAPFIDGKTTGKFSKKHEDKINEIRQLLLSILEDDHDWMECLRYVDTIQRVGVSHHFQEEIEMVLQRYYEATGGCVHGLHTLHDVSLSFRLLRQHGHQVSTDVFKSFKGVDGKFRDDINQDMNGLIELYEASCLSFDGEHELDEAASISITHFRLDENLENMDFSSSMINFRLLHPYHNSIEGLPERYFLQNLLGNSVRENALRELSAMDLKTRKLAYQQEFLQISKWWNELGFASELKLVRNQPLKWYTWSMAALIDDVSLSRQRVELTKCMAFLHLIDDIFDLYGTPDELMIFAEAVNKWDYAAVDTLPDYMKMCYKALLDTTNEIAHNIHQNYGHNPIDSLKATWAVLCNAFVVESKWFDSGELPPAQVYLENGKVSSGAHMVTVHLFFLLGLGGNGKNGAVDIDDIFMPEELISSAGTIVRLWDDLRSTKDEHQDGKDGSYIEYYMKENEGKTIAQTREHVKELIARAWKRLNYECFKLNHSSALPFKKACLNLARMIPLIYNSDDRQSLPVLTEYINFMLFDQISSD